MTFLANSGQMLSALGGANPEPPGTFRWRLTPGQEAIWISSQLSAEQGTYNISVAYEIVGRLDPGRLKSALDAVVCRHHVLAARIDDSGETIHQVVVERPEAPLLMTVVDPTEVDWASRVTEFASRPFRLTEELPIRAALFQLESARHAFVLCVHHIVADGWSVDLIVRDLSAAYAGKLKAECSPGEQFAHFAREDDCAEQLAHRAASREYWRSQLTGAPQVLELPTSNPRPPVKTFSGASFVMALPPATFADLQQFCVTRRCTTPSVLLACYVALIHVYTAQPDFLIGIPVSGRTAENSEQVVGLFANMIPLRARVNPRLSFHELLAQTRSATLEALDWQDYPFASIIRDLNPIRSLTRTPVVQQVFNYVRPTSRFEIEHAHVTRVDLETTHSKYDFALQFVDTHAQLTCMIVYDAELFSESWVCCFYQRLLGVLQFAMSNPERTLDEFVERYESKWGTTGQEVWGNADA